MDSWRVAVLGDGGVGKTALAVQFTLNCFVGGYPLIALICTPIERLCVGRFLLPQSDVSSRNAEEYATLRDQWVREGQGFILVYSIASRATFDRLDVFRQAMLKVKRQKPVFMLVGNKCDKQYEREVSREEGATLARNFGCEFLETSAKTPTNVERLFVDLVRLLRQTKQAEQGMQGQPRVRDDRVGSKPSGKGPGKIKCIIM
ncbi:hypothetical protein EVJ58_g653 [Rhodofomes roseus]|uniref:Ras protein n=1 Tax=Rhodofomes roseus TaxID=34475 RepID=A0A4Y9Z4V6_9APHY|nr:hypothetical protein EVJ58_g653 [Rhodofomes roseus]